MSDTVKKKLKRKQRARAASRRPEKSAASVARPVLELVALPVATRTESRQPEPSRLDEAQALVYEAWQAPTIDRAVALARKALATSPGCADALLLLAKHEPDPAVARRLVEEAVAAGARVLGPRAFEDDVGHFWGLVETRPYMRALATLADLLWAQGERVEAMAHWEDVLRLNPGDNQGVRHVVVGHLLELGRDGDAQALLDRYDEENAWMSYGRALSAFRREGDTPASRALLARAREVNRFAPAYLTGRKPLPRYLPEEHGRGDEAEAVVYASQGLAAWHATRGAMAWLSDQAG